MRDEKSNGNEARFPSRDITPVLKGWDYEPGAINVRKVAGLDGLPKLQMRLDLGVLQMEMSGRPDGARPQGCESFLEYVEQQLVEHKKRHGTESGFHLDGVQCQQLREESLMYYHRYLSLFVLEEFPGVVRDTAHNLRVLDVCGQFAEEEEDRLILEQYRPYIIMMHARAEATIFVSKEQYAQAMQVIETGLSDIKEFFTSVGHRQEYNRSNEVRVLKRFAREIRRKLPIAPIVKLRRKLEKAVQSERYEDAAALRDQIAAMENAKPVNQK